MTRLVSSLSFSASACDESDVSNESESIWNTDEIAVLRNFFKDVQKENRKLKASCAEVNDRSVLLFCLSILSAFKKGEL